MFHKNSDDAAWRQISGIKVGVEAGMSVDEMRVGLGKLFEEVERLMVEEMKDEPAPKIRYSRFLQGWERWERPFTLKEKMRGAKEEAEPSPQGEKGEQTTSSPQARRFAERKATMDARTYLWDPVRAVCMRLEISQSRLSYLSKMHSGMSVKEIGDRLVARKLKPLFWGILHHFTMNLWGSAGNVRSYMKNTDKGVVSVIPEQMDQIELKRELWSAWKRFKRSAEFNKEIWAHECGFASYARMRRACMLEYGLTPEMLELQVVEEICEFEWAAEQLTRRRDMISDPKIEPEKKPTEPFCDGWSAIEYYYPEWTRKMAEAFRVRV